MDIITLKDARERGLKHYFTGVPCKNGHIAKRYVAGNTCFSCNDEKMQRYRDAKRQWPDRGLMQASAGARSDAINRGLKFFQGSHPCKDASHIGLRYAKSGLCVQCAKKAARDSYFWMLRQAERKIDNAISCDQINGERHQEFIAKTTSRKFLESMFN